MKNHYDSKVLWSRLFLFVGLVLSGLLSYGQIMVTTTANSGEGSLRAAIEAANATAENDIIKFNIEEEAPYRIFLQSNLPAIIYPVVLDATNDLTGLPTVEINGRDLPLNPDQTDLEFKPKGFYFIEGSSGSVIKGFIFASFGFVEEQDGVETNYNAGYGIAVRGSGEHTIQANFFGVGIDGVTPLKNVFGLYLNQGSYNLIGGPNPGDKNVFAGSWRAGVLSGYESNYNTFEGNYFGISPDGTGVIPNSHGLAISFPSHHNHIEANTIGGNEVGLNLVGINNIVVNNLIGTNPNGDAAMPNEYGIVVHYGENKIGLPGRGNLISGNGKGIFIWSRYADSVKKNTIIHGNYIGTDKNALLAIPNGIGIQIENNTSDNQIGGTNEGEGNIISGNNDFGIELLAPGNTIMGNKIGLNKNGEPLGNGVTGINIKGSTAVGNIIGDLQNGKNIISSNGVNGIAIHEEAKDNRIIGNYIGTNAEGTEARGNGSRGVAIWPSMRTEVIGNLISGHTTHDANGIFIYTSSGHTVFGNKIGTNANGTASIPNTIGIRLMDASDNLIGGEGPGEANQISGNSSSGIFLLQHSMNNRFSRNNIHNNGNIGIDLWPEGITANDMDDKDTGPNLLQNFPEISSGATFTDGRVSLEYLVPSKPNYAAFPLKIEFFLDDGSRQGKEYLATTEYTETDVRGKPKPKTFSFYIPEGSSFSPGDKILATATDANGNTSEFGAGVLVSGDCTLLDWYADADEDGLGDPNDTTTSCTQPTGYVSNSDDCDDTDADIGSGTTWYADKDGDGFGDPDDTRMACEQPENYVANSEDCDDTDAVINPDATNVCNDCDATTDTEDCNEPIDCPGTDVLTLSEKCTEGATVHWVINNPGTCSVEVRWESKKTNESGVMTAMPGDTFFSTKKSTKGPTQVTIYWPDSNGNEVKTTTNASGLICTSSTELTTTSVDETSEDLEEGLKVYPNPITNEGIWMHFKERDYPATFTVAAYDLGGRLLAKTLIDVEVQGGDILWAVDHSRWIPGIYVLNVNNGVEVYQIKIIK